MGLCLKFTDTFNNRIMLADAYLAAAKKIYLRPQFARSRAHVLYAIALEKSGNPDLAEQEFKKMKARFSYFEARLQYGFFLKRLGREGEARQVILDMTDEAPHLSSRERRDSRAWIAQARAELVSESGSFSVKP